MVDTRLITVSWLSIVVGGMCLPRQAYLARPTIRNVTIISNDGMSLCRPPTSIFFDARSQIEPLFLLVETRQAASSAAFHRSSRQERLGWPG